MSKYKTRSEKLLKIIQKLGSNSELSINEIRKDVGSLSEARSISRLFTEIGIVESHIKRNDKTKRDAEYIKYAGDWSLSREQMMLVNQYIMGEREAGKYIKLVEFLKPRLKNVGDKARSEHTVPHSREKEGHSAIKKGVEGLDAAGSNRPDPEKAEKFVKDFVDVQDIAKRQYSVNKKDGESSDNA